jgi:hypothetical protein
MRLPRTKGTRRNQNRQNQEPRPSATAKAALPLKKVADGHSALPVKAKGEIAVDQ